MTVIDRFEGEYAVIETENGTETVLRKKLPENSREGDVIELKNGTYIINKEAAAQRRKKIREKLKKLRK